MLQNLANRTVMRMFADAVATEITLLLTEFVEYAQSLLRSAMDCPVLSKNPGHNSAHQI